MIEVCQFCRMHKIERPAWASAKFLSTGAWFYVCEEHFKSMHCELGDGLGRLIEQPVPE
jgi:hypothetical protein